MKVKNWLKSLLAGIGIGVASAVPGVSGGTIAVILKVYEKLIWAVANIFKEFKRAIIILIPIILGLIIGFIPAFFLMYEALKGFVFGVICIFAGFIIGSFPQITKEVKNVEPSKKQIIILVITFVLTVLIGVLSIVIKADVSSLFDDPKWWLYIVVIPVGILASIALVVPGISGGMILILVGFYAPLITKTGEIVKECFSGNWSHFGSQVGIICCFAVGVIVGFFIVSKLMDRLLGKYRTTTFFGIIGFVLGSIIALFLNFEIWQYYLNWSTGGQGFVAKEIEIPLGIALLVIVAVLSYLLTKYLEKKTDQGKPC